ncbi:MAG: PQQ-binding-like beta-propeller repeat protein, partial [Chloroflexota bacterium]
MFFRDKAYRAGRELLMLAAVLLAVSGVAAAFAWPWLPQTPAGGPVLAKYTPVRDGDARLMLQTEADGTVTGWLAQNTRLIPGLRVSTDARQAVADAVIEAMKLPGEDSIPDNELQRRLEATTVVETRDYSVSATGKVSEIWQYVARDAQGDRFIAFYNPEANLDVVSMPPAMMIPAEAEEGDSWSRTGKLGESSYEWTGRVVSIGRYDGAAGQFDDCLQVESRLVLTGGEGPTDNLTRDWYCDGLGWVEGHSLEPSASLKQRTVWLGVNGALPPDTPLPPAPQTLQVAPAPTPALAEPDRWRMSRVGRARATGETSETTILPTWIPTDPPLLLAAGFGSDLVAFDTHASGAPPRWRFHVDGTVYGQPVFDPVTGRIYFGASDKRVYALDARGLFLWSFQTEDNVAARPLIAGDRVIAASEDGTVYGLDATTGARQWSFQAEDGITSWPTLVDDTVIIGSDDRNVYGLDPASGEQRWSLPAEGPVEAPIVADHASGTVYVASSDGTLLAFKPAECAEECKTLWSVEPGGSLRTAPLLAGNLAVVIDEEGELIAVHQEDGKRAWALGGITYVGAPVLVGDAIVAASAKGQIERVSLDGQRL